MEISSAIEEMCGDASWKEVENCVYDVLDRFLQRYEDNPSAYQIFLQLCGESYCVRRKLNGKLRQYLLFEPYMTQETRIVLEKQLLQSLLVYLDEEMRSTYTEINPLFSRVHEKLLLIVNSSKGIEPVSRLLELFDGRFFHLKNGFSSIASEQTKQEENLILKLKGRSVPMELRQWLWWYIVHNPQKLKENEWRLKANQTLLGVAEPWKSPISVMVFRLVRDALNEDYAMFNKNQSSDLADRIASLVNQYYVLTKSHSTYFVPLAIPIVIIFSNKSAKELELLNIFAVLIESYLHNPLRGDAISGSQRVWRRLALDQPQLFRHIESIFTKIPSVKKRLSILESPSEIFMSWLQVSFVGYLRVDALFYAWNQCLLKTRCGLTWKEAMEQLCLAITSILSKEIFLVQTTGDLQVLLESKPRDLYTSDIRHIFN